MRRMPPDTPLHPAREVEGGASAQPVDEQDRARLVDFLVGGRRRAGRSLQDIAAATRIAPRHLQALERGAVESLPGGVYRRAIVRDYARSVGIDPASALELLERTLRIEASLPDLEELHAARGVVTGRPTGARGWTRGLMAAWPPEWLAAVRPWALPIGALAILTFAGFAAQRMLAGWRAEPPTAAAALEELQRYDIRLPPEARAAGTSGTPRGEARAEARELQLVITSQPEGARVTVDGVGWGVTPLTIRHLPAGEKVVRLTKDGYLARERRVRLGGERGTAAVRVTLPPRELDVPEVDRSSS